MGPTSEAGGGDEHGGREADGGRRAARAGRDPGRPGPGAGPGGAPSAVALTPILSAHYRPADLARVREAAPGSRLVVVSTEGLADGPLDDVEVLLRGFIPTEVFERLVARMPALRWVHSASAGVERVLTPAVRERGLVVTNARGVFSRPIAEYVLLMILAVSRKLPELLELQRERTWQPLEGRELRDVTVGVVGLGSIGRDVAALAGALGCRVVAVRRRAEEGGAATSAVGGPVAADEPPGRAETDGQPEQAAAGQLRLAAVHGPEGLPDLLAESDFVVLALPLTPETEDLIDDAALARIKPGAWLINIARGRLIDEHALGRALRAGRLGGAVLDAFREEPLPPSSPLYDLPNVIVTPHTSWSSARVVDRSVGLFCENLRRYGAGEALLNVVDAAAGY